MGLSYERFMLTNKSGNQLEESEMGQLGEKA
jgi:hypothetical protein